MRVSNKTIYALYKGDTFIDVGTDVELSLRIGLSPTRIRHYATPRYKKKRNDDDYIAVRVGREKEFCDEIR